VTAGASVAVPNADGTVARVELGLHPAVPVVQRPPASARRAYAAAHVVVDARADVDPTTEAVVDWDATLAFRRHLWSLGLGVAEAMDTAQRGQGISYPIVRMLVERTLEAARNDGGEVACGIVTDQLAPGAHPLSRITEAYLEQLEHVESHGGLAVMMCSRNLAASADDPDAYHDVYGTVLAAARRPVVLHWLGPMFDPQLEGYWGAREVDRAMDEVVALIAVHAAKVEGIKVSLLDAQLEVALRRRLPSGVRCYTGDDFNYPDLIRGDEAGHSDALLGIFDPIAAAAAAALAALDRGDTGAYDRILAPTVPLSRHLFTAPTFHYKTGIVFLAYLAGHQDHFRMLGGHESSRSAVHLARALVLADAAGVLPDPELAAARARTFLALAGVPQPV
jgi:hypothetical protein